MKFVAKLLVLLSLLLSPLAMQPATASTHHAMASEMARHGGHHSQKPKSAIPGECAMGCASALPAFDLPMLGESDWAPVAAEPARIPVLSGLSPEADTPPPRAA